MTDAAFAHFDGIAPLAGFGTPCEGSAPSAVSRLVQGGELFAAPPGDDPFLPAASQVRVRRGGEARYLQAELWYPGKAGTMTVHHAGQLVDQAELADGWIHAAVDLDDVPVGAEFDIAFRDDDGTPVEGVLIRRLFLSATWGRGRRKRLKCHYPFELAATFENFAVYPCCARQWLKGNQCAGNTRTEPLEEIWNGPVYRRMRTQFLEGRYGETCREDVCPVLNGDRAAVEPSEAVIHAVNEGITELPFGPAFMHHDIDRGCNLDCVMCRDEKILPREGNVAHAIDDMKSAMAMGGLEQIWFSGAGEVFAMRQLVKLLETDAFSAHGVRLAINTNLTYFNEKLWKRIGHNRIMHIVVSADGASSEVYDAIRIGAHWSELVENMRFLASLRHAGKIGGMAWNYTVQRGNVRDVAAAVTFARELGFDAIRFIAQLGALSRTNGNMFEDYDLDALDALYDQLASVDALDDPHVAIGELYMRDRQYRSAEHRLNLAQHIFERRGYSGDDAGPVPAGDWAKSVRLIRSVMDERSGAPDPAVSVQNKAFLRDFFAATREPGPALPLVQRLRSHVSGPEAENRRTARWARVVADAR